MATAKTMLSAAASLAASAVLIRSMVQQFFPRKIRDYIFSSAFSFFTTVSSKLTINVHQFHGSLPNEMYKAAETYLSSKISPNTSCLQVAVQEDSKGLEVAMEEGETVVDFFQGIEFRWKWICKEKQKLAIKHRRNDSKTPMLETKFFVLSLGFSWLRECMLLLVCGMKQQVWSGYSRIRKLRGFGLCSARDIERRGQFSR